MHVHLYGCASTWLEAMTSHLRCTDRSTWAIRSTCMQVSAAAAPGAAARAELGLEDDYYSTSAGQRERMLASTERLNKTGDRIQQGQQQLLETEVGCQC